MEIFNQLKQPFEELETLLDEDDKILKAKTMYKIIITLYRLRKVRIFIFPLIKTDNKIYKNFYFAYYNITY